jgi:hypothetical protein
MSTAHATDPIGARDLASEAGKDLAPPLKKDLSKQPSNETSSTPSTGADGTMYLAVRTLQILQIPRDEISTFVPSSHMMFTTIAMMDEIMHTNRYWQNRSLRWNPMASRLYYGILFYIQTIRCMVFAGIANSHLKQLLRDFEEDFSYEDLPIAGPMMPFIKALNVSQPSSSEYGYVTPRLMPTTGATNDNSFTLDELVRTLLPNLTGLRRGFLRMRLIGVNNHAQFWDHNLSGQAQADLAVAIAHNAANEQSRDARIMPGTVQPIAWNERNRDQFQREPVALRVPAPAAINDQMTWREFLGFSGNLQWFSELSALMAHHAKHWKNSGNMSHASIQNGQSGLIVCRSNAVYLNRNAHRDTAYETINHLSTLESAVSDPTPPVEKISALTQINWVPAPNFCPTNDNTGSVGYTRHGPWWHVAPNRWTSQPFTPSIALPTILSDKMHLDRPNLDPSTQ